MSMAPLKAIHKKVLVCALLASAAAFVPTLASAAAIDFQLREDGVVVATASGGSSFNTTLNAPDLTANITGVTQPTLPSPGLLFSNNISATSGGGTGSHTFDIFVTASGLTDPVNPFLGIISGLTQNLLLNFTTTLSTLISSTNQLFTGTLMDSANFATIGSNQGFNLENTGAGPYSVTAQFHLTTVSNGSGGFLSGASNATINLLAVPGPIVGAGLPGLIAACMGLFGLSRRRKRLAA